MNYQLSQSINVRNVIDHTTQKLTIDQYLDALGTDSLMLESVTLEELEATYLYGLAGMNDRVYLDAITTTRNRLVRTMAAFTRELNKQLNSTGIAAETAEIGRPSKAGALAVVTARIPLSDGQSIGVVFHSPSGDPSKIAADDDLVAFRFLLNKRDVTHVVAPSGGKDISLKQTTLTLANLAERNTAKFQAKQEEMKTKEGELTTLQLNTEQLQAEADNLIEQADMLVQSAAQAASEEERGRARLEKAKAENDRLRAILAGLGQAGTGPTPATPEQGQTQYQGKPLQELNPTLAKSISNSLDVIAGIDAGDPKYAGYDRALFVSSIVNKIKTPHKHGRQDEVNAALAQISQRQQSLAKPLISTRNGIWKLGTDIAAPAPTPTPQPDESPLVQAGVMRGETYSNLVIHDLDAETVQIEGSSANGQVMVNLTQRGQKNAMRMSIDPAELKRAIEQAKAGELVARMQVWSDRIDAMTPIQTRALADAAGTGSRLQGEELKATLKQIGPDSLDAADAIAKTSEIKPVDAEFWYGLRARPLSIGAQPAGSVAYIPPEDAKTDPRIAKMVSLAGESSVRHGAAGYDRELTPKEVADFELVDFGRLAAAWDEGRRAAALEELKGAIKTQLDGGDDSAEIWRSFMRPNGDLVTSNPFYDYGDERYYSDQLTLAMQEAGYSGGIQAMYQAMVEEISAVEGGDDEQALIDQAKRNQAAAEEVVVGQVKSAKWPQGWAPKAITGADSTFTPEDSQIPEDAGYRLPHIEIDVPTHEAYDFESDGYYVLPNVDAMGAPQGTFKVLVGDGGTLKGAEAAGSVEEAIGAMIEDYKEELDAHIKKHGLTRLEEVDLTDTMDPSTSNQWDESNPKALEALQALEALKGETDIDAYMAKMEAAFNTLDQLGLIEKHEPYLHTVSDRLTELMEAEGV